MRRITCADLERLGLYDCSGCCVRCHAGKCPDEFTFETSDAAGERVRIELCCGSDGVDWGSSTFARVLSVAPAAEAVPA